MITEWTDPRGGVRVLRILFGPWSIHPVAPTLVAFVLFYFSSTQMRIYASTQPEPMYVAWIVEVPNAVFASMGILIPLYVLPLAWRRWVRRPISRVPYLGIIATASILTALIGEEFILLSANTGPMNLLSTSLHALRIFLAIAIFQGVVGLTSARLEVQVRRAEGALQLAHDQRISMLKSDERDRQTVADFLHNRVQSELMVIAMELRSAMTTGAHGISPQIESLAQRLDRLRSVDVRSAGRQLSPAISTLGLLKVLDELAETYRGQIVVTVSIANSLSAWSHPGTKPVSGPLAVFRIVEQGLINAVVHGKAAHVAISVSAVDSGVKVTVDDDGTGLSATTLTGSGSAIIQAWVSELGGRWSLTAIEPEGARLEAVINLDGGYPEGSSEGSIHLFPA